MALKGKDRRQENIHKTRFSAQELGKLVVIEFIYTYNIDEFRLTCNKCNIFKETLFLIEQRLICSLFI